jgi:hypothetical protein
MDMVAVIEHGAQPRGVRRVAHARIEVDDTVEDRVAANPCVDAPSDALSLRAVRARSRVIRGSLERWKRPDNDRQAVIVGARRDLCQAEDDVGCRERRYRCAGVIVAKYTKAS